MKHLLDLFNKISKYDSNETFLNYESDDGWSSLSTTEFVLKVKYLTLALKSIGIKKDTAVAIISKSSPWWIIVNYAINFAGGITVPIFSNISSKNLLYELEDCEIKYAFVSLNENVEHIKKYSWNKIITKDINIDKKENVMSLEELFVLGEDLFKKDKSLWDKISINEDDLYSIIYTSGSTGYPKGVELTHKNVMSQINAGNKVLDFEKNQSALSFLPVAHILENTLVNVYLSGNISIYFVHNVNKIKYFLSTINPHYMSLVPMLLQKIYNKIVSNINESSFIKKTIGNFAIDRAMRRNPHKRKTFLDIILDKIVYKKIRQIFGKNIKYMLSGGAKLPIEISNFFLNVKLPIREGYGLSECSPVVCLNTNSKYKSGTCGGVFAELEVKLAKDNELLVKGSSVMRGYHKQKEATDKTIIDDWLHTGDLASIDKDGFITITGRKKELFKTSIGKYIRPVEIENLLARLSYINHSIIVANDRVYVSALIFVDDLSLDVLREKEKSLIDLDGEQILQHDIFISTIKQTIKEINKKLDKHEKILSHRIINKTLSIEEGELTPSMKVNRSIVEDKNKEIIHSMYKS